MILPSLLFPTNFLYLLAFSSRRDGFPMLYGFSRRTNYSALYGRIIRNYLEHTNTTHSLVCIHHITSDICSWFINMETWDPSGSLFKSLKNISSCNIQKLNLLKPKLGTFYSVEKVDRWSEGKKAQGCSNFGQEIAIQSGNLALTRPWQHWVSAKWDLVKWDWTVCARQFTIFVAYFWHMHKNSNIMQSQILNLQCGSGANRSFRKRSHSRLQITTVFRISWRTHCKLYCNMDLILRYISM